MPFSDQRYSHSGQDRTADAFGTGALEDYIDSFVRTGEFCCRPLPVETVLIERDKGDLVVVRYFKIKRFL